MDENYQTRYSINGKKLSIGSGLGGGINLSITPKFNIFAEFNFTLRPFFAPVEIRIKDDKKKDNDRTGNFQINNIIINFGLHFDFFKRENDVYSLD